MDTATQLPSRILMIHNPLPNELHSTYIQMYSFKYQATTALGAAALIRKPLRQVRARFQPDHGLRRSNPPTDAVASILAEQSSNNSSQGELVVPQNSHNIGSSSSLLSEMTVMIPEPIKKKGGFLDEIDTEPHYA